jgi:hypothetical protein
MGWRRGVIFEGKRDGNAEFTEIGTQRAQRKRRSVRLKE